MGNQALKLNPDDGLYTGVADIKITTRGSDWYFTVSSVMFAATLIFMGVAFTVPRRNRVFHYLVSAITLTSAIAYFTMGSNLGYAAIKVEFARHEGIVRGSYRQIFYARYIEYFLTTPLLLISVFLTAGIPWPNLLWTVFLAETYVVSLLIGALVDSTYKWGYFVFAVFGLFAVSYNLLFVGRLHARALGPNPSRTFLIGSACLVSLWFIYPICWGVSEGGNIIAPDSESIFYGILDLLTKPVFGAFLIWGHRNIDPAQIGLNIRDYEDAPVTEKAAFGTTPATADVPAAGVTAPAAAVTTDAHAHGTTGESAV